MNALQKEGNRIVSRLFAAGYAFSKDSSLYMQAHVDLTSSELQILHIKVMCMYIYVCT